MRNQVKWTNKMIKRHKALLSEGQTHSYCAVVLGDEFGVKLSRNSCIGAAMRNGYQGLNRVKKEGGRGSVPVPTHVTVVESVRTGSRRHVPIPQSKTTLRTES